ncbi:MAG: FAD-dependent oxidoreductase [Gammaproteobacteria bacterium]|nr:FAD-dependent oxidoreductase [Gammaproteobacteria bacterium]MBT8055880.1 FAD-dependent oxidoreductase [Gammaproteobacteria bacterium]
MTDNKPSRRLTPSYRPEQTRSTPPCQHACPNCGDIRGWIGIVAQAEKNGIPKKQAFERAWRTIADVNPFPASLGRICPHPCESDCNRGDKDEPLAINAMERFLGDYAIEQGLKFDSPVKEDHCKSIGVVGAGPSGLSFAYQVRRRGHDVTVYDGRDKPGGMLRYGIPDYRLPPAVLDAEIERIVALGVRLVMNIRVGLDLSLNDLYERHDHVYVGIGAQQGMTMEIEGEDGPGVITAVDYLRAMNGGQPPSVGEDVVVVGGGNSAIDAARTARRAGARVTLLYRRRIEEMPANPSDIEEAIEESVNMVFLAAPLRVERSDRGVPAALHAVRIKLEGEDESGRPRPVAVPGSDFRIPVSGVITAISQAPDFNGLEHCEDLLDAGGPKGSREGLLFGGDVLGLGIAGNAIVQGRYAAERLHETFMGIVKSPDESLPILDGQKVNFATKAFMPMARPEAVSADERLGNPTLEVYGTLNEGQFLNEAGRCFSCGSCHGCERCTMYCTSNSFTRLDNAGPGRYFSLDLAACQECGKCVEVCPCGFLQLS